MAVVRGRGAEKNRKRINHCLCPCRVEETDGLEANALPTSVDDRSRSMSLRMLADAHATSEVII